MDAIEHYTQDIFSVSYVCKRYSCPAFLPALDSVSQNFVKILIPLGADEHGFGLFI